MSEPFDSSRSLTALEQDSTVIAVIEMSQSSWLVAAVIPGVERQPLKKLDADEEALLKLLHRWRNEANRAGRQIKRIVVAYEAGRDGFWLARWLRRRDVEAYVLQEPAELDRLGVIVVAPGFEPFVTIGHHRVRSEANDRDAGSVLSRRVACHPSRTGKPPPLQPPG
jgi:transposase